MLQSLTIKNYAIIQELQVGFDEGFSVITGETGAGKSIIIGALGLILGQRADTSVLRNPDEKCIIEGSFRCEWSPVLETFFLSNDLDPEIPLILRREIATGGKSRAFINDTPVPLNILRELGLQLIDIHSQHANLELGKRAFQLKVIDWYGTLESTLAEYQKVYFLMKNLEEDYQKLIEAEAKEKADFDYHLFQFNQLEETRLQPGEQEKLEQEQEMLSHSEEIREGLASIFNIFEGEELALLSRTKEVYSILGKLKSYLGEASGLHQRTESLFFELQDIAAECSSLANQCDFNPERLSEVNERLDLIYTLEKKHHVTSVEELIEIRNQLDLKIQSVASYQERINDLGIKIEKIRNEAYSIAGELSRKRLSLCGNASKEVLAYLEGLGMPNASFSIKLQQNNELSANGIDEAMFLFNANKGGRPEEIGKVASGGEMSRLMLAIKTLVAKSKALPAIIFDEIDTGISGEIALKMGEMLRNMAQYMQVINITHLPQIAAKGNHHFWVFKAESLELTTTGIKKLDKEERLLEIAKMLSGDNPSDAAIENARALMN